MKMNEFEIKIPATSANLGLGFDSMGIAITKFLTIKAVKNSEWGFDFAKKGLEKLPDDEKNLVAETAIKIARQYNKEMPPLHIYMDSEIPLAHGLGSSSSAIVAGIELADYFCDLGLSDFDKIYIGSRLEGHPDNIGPCVTGGLFVGYYSHGEMNYYTNSLDGISLIASVPNYEINTIEARDSLPDRYLKEQAVEQNAKNNVMLLSIWNQDYDLMGKLMMQDNFHEPYRRPLINEYEEIKKISLNNDAYATVISGAGPTLLTFCPTDKAEEIFEALKQVKTCKHLPVKVYYK